MDLKISPAEVRAAMSGNILFLAIKAVVGKLTASDHLAGNCKYMSNIKCSFFDS